MDLLVIRATSTRTTAMTAPASTTDTTSQREISIQEVEPEEFCHLAISTRKLVRQDDLSNGKRGLLDPEAGIRFVIDQARLMRFDSI